MWDRWKSFVSSRPLLMAVVWFLSAIGFGISGQAMGGVIEKDTLMRLIFGCVLVLGCLSLIFSVFCVIEWVIKRVIGRYEWIYVMPSNEIVNKPCYDDSNFRAAAYCLRMKVGGWFRVSRRMTTPYEGERIDHVRYDGDGDMTITLPHAKFTVPVSCAIRYLRHPCAQDREFGTSLNNLIIHSDWCDKHERELNMIHTTLGLLLDELSGKSGSSNRPPMWMKRLHLNVIDVLMKDLPVWSKFRSNPAMKDENPNPELVATLEASAEDAAKDAVPASKS